MYLSSDYSASEMIQLANWKTIKENATIKITNIHTWIAMNLRCIIVMIDVQERSLQWNKQLKHLWKKPGFKLIQTFQCSINRLPTAITRGYKAICELVKGKFWLSCYQWCRFTGPTLQLNSRGSYNDSKKSGSTSSLLLFVEYLSHRLFQIFQLSWL